MSSYRDLALKVPKDIRQNIHDRQMIAKAFHTPDFMKYIFDIWFSYIDPTGHRDWDCNICRTVCVENWQRIKSELDNLVTEQKLLDAL